MTRCSDRDSDADYRVQRFGENSMRFQPGPGSTKPQSPRVALVIGGLACVGFPALLTAIAPVSYLRLSQTDGVVNATSRTCLLFCIPYNIQHVTDVLSVNHRFIAGEVLNPYERDANGDINTTVSEDEGFLVLTGDGNSLEVPLSPHDIASHEAAIDAFLKSDQPELTLFCVSNWKGAVFAGVPLCGLTALYLLGVMTTIYRFARRFIKPV